MWHRSRSERSAQDGKWHHAVARRSRAEQWWERGTLFEETRGQDQHAVLHGLPGSSSGVLSNILGDPPNHKILEHSIDMFSIC